jgi:hypothetical protein
MILVYFCDQRGTAFIPTNSRISFGLLRNALSEFLSPNKDRYTTNAKRYTLDPVIQFRLVYIKHGNGGVFKSGDFFNVRKSVITILISKDCLWYKCFHSTISKTLKTSHNCCVVLRLSFIKLVSALELDDILNSLFYQTGNPCNTFSNEGKARVISRVIPTYPETYVANQNRALSLNRKKEIARACEYRETEWEMMSLIELLVSFLYFDSWMF